MRRPRKRSVAGKPSRRRRNALVDGWVCPKCGQVAARHGRGGARACHGGDGPFAGCRGLECECTDGKCYSKKSWRLGWRRSPCPNAVCYHCGWKGTVRSRDFERAYGLSRCPKSSTGWHHPVLRVVPNTRPNSLALICVCSECGRKGTSTLDPIADILWLAGDEPESRTET